MPTFTALLTLTTIFPLPTDIICTFVRNLLTKMTENRSYLQKYAMHFGTYMGIYWILKFILFPLGFHIPFLSLLFVILTLAVPFIGYHYVKMYRDKICGGSIQFSHAVLFTIFMYMFASLLVAVAHYAYFQFIDHGFIINSYIQLWDELMTRFDGKSRDNKRNDRYCPFTYFHQYYHATPVMGCILGKFTGHSYRIDGNEESTTGKQYPGPIIIRNS